MSSIRYKYPDSNVSLAAGQVYIYKSGTKEPKDSYTDKEHQFRHPHPIILDYHGCSSIFIDGVCWVELYDQNGVLLASQVDIEDIKDFKHGWSG